MTELKQNNRFVIYFEDRYQYHDEESSSKPSYCSFDGSFRDHTSPFKIGVFASSERIACGMVVLEEISQGKAKPNIQDIRIPNQVLSLLYNARLNVSLLEREGKNLLQQALEFQESIKNLAGVYQGYHLDDGKQVKFQSIAIQAFPDGLIKLKSIDRPRPIYARIVDFRKETSLVLVLDFEPAKRYHKIQIVLDVKKVSKYATEKCYVGIYGGVDIHDKPEAGRIIVFPSHRSFEELVADSTPLLPTEPLPVEFQDPLRGGLLREFFGSDSFFHGADPPNLLDKVPHLRAQSLRDLDSKSLLDSNYTNEQGLLFLAEQIKKATWVFNTRIIPPDVKPYYTGRAKVWQESIIESVKQGVNFHEIVSGFWVKEAEALKELLGNDYHAVEVEMPYRSMLNFAVLKFPDEADEVWFGWMIGPGRTLNDPCFRSKDPTIVQIFIDWFRDLSASGKEI